MSGLLPMRLVNSLFQLKTSRLITGWYENNCITYAYWLFVILFAIFLKNPFHYKLFMSDFYIQELSILLELCLWLLLSYSHQKSNQNSIRLNLSQRRFLSYRNQSYHIKINLQTEMRHFLNKNKCFNRKRHLSIRESHGKHRHK